MQNNIDILLTTSNGFHGNATAIMSFLPYSKLHALFIIVTSANYYMLCNHGNLAMQTIPSRC
jgi:hypothetical protein